MIGDSLYLKDISGTYSLKSLATGQGVETGTGIVDTSTHLVNQVSIFTAKAEIGGDVGFEYNTSTNTLSVPAITLNSSVNHDRIKFGSGTAGIGGSNGRVVVGDSLYAETVFISGFVNTDSVFVWADANHKLTYAIRSAHADWVFDQNWIWNDQVRFWKQKNELPLSYRDELGKIVSPGQLKKPYSQSDQQLLAEIEKNYLFDEEVRGAINELRLQVSELKDQVNELKKHKIGRLRRCGKR